MVCCGVVYLGLCGLLGFGFGLAVSGSAVLVVVGG